MITADKLRANKDYVINLSEVWTERHEIELEKIEKTLIEYLYEYPHLNKICLPFDISYPVICKIRELGYDVQLESRRMGTEPIPRKGYTMAW